MGSNALAKIEREREREFARARALSKFLCENFLPSVVKCKSKAITKCQASQPASQAVKPPAGATLATLVVEPDPLPSCELELFHPTPADWNWMLEQPQCLANLTMSPGCLPNSQTNDTWQPCHTPTHTNTHTYTRKERN